MAPSVIILVTGTIFAMWLGEKITDKGIGNRISLLIMVGIIATLPLSFAQEVVSRVSENNGGLDSDLIELILVDCYHRPFHSVGNGGASNPSTICQKNSRRC